VVRLELATDQARPAGGGHPEIVGQLELADGIVLAADQFLHDLEEHPRRVAAQNAVGDVHHLGVERAKGADPVVGLADLQGVEQVGHGVGDTELLCGGHLDDAMGIQVGIEQVLEAFTGRFPAQNILNHLEQVVVFPVEVEFRETVLHAATFFEGLLA